MISTKKIAPSNASFGRELSALMDIHKEEKNIAIYQRDISPLHKTLHNLEDQSIECRAIGSITEITETLDTYFSDHLPKSKVLQNDIIDLLYRFQEVAKVDSFRIYFATIDNDMCRKFHTDINTLRLLCTYVGPGTLWLSDEIADQDPDQDFIHEEDIYQVETGNVLILKGALYPNAKAVMHRSPSIESKGSRRLLLRIDTNETLNHWI